MTSPNSKPGAVRALFTAVLVLFPGVASAGWDQLNLPRGVTPYSNTVYDLHMLVLWVCVAIGVVVFGAIFYSIFKFRHSQGAISAQWHESTMVEVLWTTVPFVILIAMAVPATTALIMMEDTSKSDLTIKVTGYQWKWHYEYVNEGVGVFSTLAHTSNVARQLNSGVDPNTVENYLLEVDNEIVVPINKKIRFLTTAADVIHAWWVPVLGWKRDAVPGYINESWATIEQAGVYRGQCTELCGKDHGFMPIVVRAVAESEYQAWIEKKKAAQAPAATSQVLPDSSQPDSSIAQRQ
ncbi:MAG: cytochrome c oxidase subunit II [Gammaproteobacteria bacterium]|nr:cytochrome c oxidase subunit II [Gammaproteobacteria bacterium]